MNRASHLINQFFKFLSAVSLTAILIVELAPSARASDSEDVLAACAAFASNGGWVTATTNAANLSAEITDPAGSVSRLSLPLVDPATENEPANARVNSCRAYFDRDSDLIAIGVSYGLRRRYSLRIGVADAKESKWIGKWTVGPASGTYQPFLLGFLEGTQSVVVGGGPSTPTKYGPGMRHGSFESLLFNPQGQQLPSTPTMRDYGSDSDPFPFYADASHNRLWFFRCVVVSAPLPRQPDCPVGWMTLVGDSSTSSEFNPRRSGEKRTDFWMSPGTFAAPDGSTVAVAETVAGLNTIWLADVQKQTLNRLTLPKRLHFPNSEEIHGAAALSPDGEVAVFPLVKEAVAFPYLMDNYDYKGTDFAAVQLHPLRLLAILPGAGPKSFGACAVDHRQGHVAVLVFRENHWEHVELKVPPSS